MIKQFSRDRKSASLFFNNIISNKRTASASIVIPEDPVMPFVHPRIIEGNSTTNLKYSIDSVVSIHDYSTVKIWPTLKDKKLCEERIFKVQWAFADAWYAYQEYAWGADELFPLSKTKNNWLGGQATTIVDSISTILLMGLKDEYQQAEEFIKTYDVYKGSSVSLFETGIRILGGLISAYDLTDDIIYLRKAEQIGDLLISNFESNNECSIPSNDILLVKPTKEKTFEERRKELQSKLSAQQFVSPTPDFFTPSWKDYNLSLDGKTAANVLNDTSSSSSFRFQQNETYSRSNEDVQQSHFRKLNSTSNYAAYLAEFGLYFEFVALSDRTGDPHYAYHALRAMQATLRAKRPSKGVIGQSMKFDGTSFDSTFFSIGAMADSFYEYIIKESLYSMPYPIKMKGDAEQAEQDLKDFGSEEKELSEHWIDVMNAFKRNVKENSKGYKWIADDGVGDSWQHLSCFSGGNLALGAFYLNDWKLPIYRSLDNLEGAEKKKQERENNLAEFLQLGKDLGETCYAMYNQSLSGLSGEDVNMTENDFANSGSDQYLLRPEVVETLFYLFRITGDTKWQEYTWNIFEDIIYQTKIPNHMNMKGESRPSGYTSLSSIHSKHPVRQNNMPSFLLSETSQ
eukprot:MONOS_389.1-p1 / transcript=MONOS_389.1 / gene=MONOS_389 / organism=Monocercomonoides_exilis_PA203 / gene_product=Endoplasmic reticulum mannosyl-oligosaccharide 1,2-alpha-mannosidase / transcript_product=Endoplasmic reticulum mannosyl-oligosaccharide 1,2-alpha-mannosidase / location=Mono_scaffold00006:191394-193532(-) / protein_length=626 / sequence_SO=supercontig / SO=protein_coding / is_pseudo=false